MLSSESDTVEGLKRSSSKETSEETGEPVVPTGDKGKETAKPEEKKPEVEDTKVENTKVEDTKVEDTKVEDYTKNCCKKLLSPKSQKYGYSAFGVAFLAATAFIVYSTFKGNIKRTSGVVLGALLAATAIGCFAMAFYSYQEEKKLQTSQLHSQEGQELPNQMMNSSSTSAVVSAVTEKV